jgi:hypothetical protein
MPQPDDLEIALDSPLLSMYLHEQMHYAAFRIMPRCSALLRTGGANWRSMSA